METSPILVETVAGEHSIRSRISESPARGAPGRLLPPLPFGAEWMHPTLGAAAEVIVVDGWKQRYMVKCGKGIDVHQGEVASSFLTPRIGCV